MTIPPTEDPLAASDRTVGVTSYPGQWTSGALKRAALLFDQIGIPKVRFRQVTKSSFPAFGSLDEFDWLRDSGIVLDIQDIDFATPAFGHEFLDAVAAETGEPIDYISKDDWRLPRVALIDRVTEAAGLDPVWARLLSNDLRRHGINAFPILENRRQIGNVFPSGTAPDTTPVLEVVLRSMPIPDDQTPWEDIIDFRNDPASMKRLRRLRVWTRKFAKTTTATSLAELKEEIEVLLDEYEEHMKLHR